MKTPQRDYKAPYAPQRSDIIDCTLESWKSRKDARWTRKNRIARLKHTIAVLKYRLKDTEEALRFTQKITKCFIVKPDHWHHLDENGNELTRKQWRIKTKKKHENTEKTY